MFRGTPRSNYSGNNGGFRGRSHKYSNGSRSSSNMATTKPKGIFADGIWHCNCTPRMPAEHFRVKKEGKNHGRWFYTCQNAEPRRCDFFLWDEDAKPREEAAVLHNSRTEPGGTMEAAQIAGREAAQAVSNQPQSAEHHRHSRSVRSLSPPPPYSTQAQGSSSAKKRKVDHTRFDAPDSDEEFYPWPLTGQEEVELAEAANRAPQTPHKAAKTDVYATPSSTTTTAKRKLPWLDYSGEEGATTTAQTPMSKPETGASNNALPTPSTTKATPSRTTLITTTDTTPTPSRFKDALSDTSPPTSNLHDTILSVLKKANITLSSETATEIKAVVSRQEMKMQGIIKGRDMVRLAVKAKEAKIVELMARIGSLEAEREVDRSLIRALRERAAGTAGAGAVEEETDDEEL